MASERKTTRRAFLKTAAWAAAAPAFVPASALGAEGRRPASDRIGLGCIGVGNMGGGHLSGLIKHPDVEIAAVCEVDAERLESARQRAQLPSARAFRDFREVLERPEIDAVLIATPDHWHAPMSIAAMKAGKDVYCEKPLTLTIGEGRKMVEAARRYGRICQTGSQQRSSAQFRRACELVRNGVLGELKTVRAGIPGNNRADPGPWTPQPIPEGFDYEMWLGPAPWQPYHPARCHYQFRFILDYSGGQVTNWGAHHFDIAQWGIGADGSGPVEAQGAGEFAPEHALFTTATKVHFECQYANGVRLICETGESGCRFEGSRGAIDVSRGSLRADPASILAADLGDDAIRLYRSDDHKQDFFDCIRTRRLPVADVEIGHRSATVCHLGNIAMLLGRPLKWDPKAERFVGDSEADRMLWRPARAPWRGVG